MSNNISAIKPLPMESASRLQWEPLTILIVDDSVTERRLLAAILGRFGHNIIEAGSGEEALVCIKDRNDNIDLILMDVNMPELDGYATSNKIRTLESDIGIEWQPIIFLSGRNTPNDIAMGIESGGDDFIAKPVNSITLQAKIHAMSRISKMRKRLIEIQHQLEKQAHFDELTGIANRRHFLSMLDKEIARSQRHSLPLSLAFFDVDKFKQVNDTYGHKVGDDVLKGIAQAITESLRREDSFGRLGGEEFCIFLPGQQLENAIKIIERYRILIEKINFKSDSSDFNVTASFGISELNKQDSVNSLLEKADQLLYRAKKNGRNRIEF
ncbi:MAG: diguanylate cyclase [Gammaproteobacteria bacterium]|jgi:two-component system, cell cycle response regulator